jgi:putative endonuclease
MVILSEAKDPDSHLTTILVVHTLCGGANESTITREPPQPMKRFFIYILASASRTLYIGMTNDLERRVREHRSKQGGFTARYSVTALVYWEEYADPRDAIAREKYLKGWKRFRKIALVESKNPEWADLAEDWV